MNIYIYTYIYTYIYIDIYETQRGRPVYTRVDRSAFFGLGPKKSQFRLSRDGHM